METEKQIQVSALVSEKDIQVLRDLAEMNERTFAAEVRVAIRNHVLRMANKLSADG
jgi:hypothetical protein